MFEEIIRNYIRTLDREALSSRDEFLSHVDDTTISYDDGSFEIVHSVDNKQES